MRALVYDIEIVKAVPTRDPRIEGVEYCGGWNDHTNMGVACICAYDYASNRYRVFTAETFGEFAALTSERFPLVGHNIVGFDNRVLSACDLAVLAPDSCYDTLAELWVAAGLGRTWAGKASAGFSLDAAAQVNFGAGKTGNGALAPVHWQQGKWGNVIDYCLEDVRLTRLLFERMALEGFAIDPRDGRNVLRTRKL